MRHSSISKAVITRLTTLRLPVRATSIRVNPLLALTIALAFLAVFMPPGPVEALSPIADAGGPYSGDEGSPIPLDASGSSDSDGTITSYEWDLDNDGDFDDATGVTTSVIFPDNGSFPIGLRVTDDEGATVTDATTVTVSNVNPTVDAGPDDTINEGGHLLQLRVVHRSR